MAAMESIRGILREAPQIRRSFGRFGGFVLMALAILAIRRGWPWIAIVSLIVGAARWADWI
jgi:hypothetical protein